MHKVRIVLTLRASISGPATTAVICDPCHLVANTPTRNPGRHIAARKVKREVKRRTTLGNALQRLPDVRPAAAKALQPPPTSGRRGSNLSPFDHFGAPH